MKRCSNCFKEKSLDSFHKRSASPDGYLCICKECNCLKSRKWNANNKDKLKNKNLLIGYGITIEEYNKFKDFCKNTCAICGCHESKYSRKLAVDHDHSNGVIRGLLCIKCNKGLGCFDDNIEVLKNAITYLESYMEVMVHAVNTREVEQVICE